MRAMCASIAEPDGSVREISVVRNRPKAGQKMLAKLATVEHLQVCYEAGLTGCTVSWQLTALARSKTGRSLPLLRRHRFFRTTCGGADWSFGVQILRQSSPGFSGSQSSTCNALSAKTDGCASANGAAAGADRWL
jgi:hypothetical protein